MENYTANRNGEMTDDEILDLIYKGDKKALEVMLKRYDELVKIKSSKFFMYGAEKNDVIQEGMIGLFKAIKDFNIQKNMTFKTFANMCIERQLITAIKTANRQKHVPLNSAISINATVDDESDDRECIELIKMDYAEDPSEIIVKSEYYNTIYKAIEESLSEYEKDVLIQYQKGKTYAEIAQVLDCKTKSVDTAMTRIRRKANKIKNDYI